MARPPYRRRRGPRSRSMSSDHPSSNDDGEAGGSDSNEATGSPRRGARRGRASFRSRARAGRRGGSRPGSRPTSAGSSNATGAGSRPNTPRPGTSGAGSGSGGAGGSGGGGAGGRPSSPDAICPICHSQISNLCITNCNHRFCRDCIRRWTSRHASCPSCRTTIHTIRNILPDGGTEIIQISRAELLAAKVNDIHSILILLFTVMSHTLLPEVSNYLEQLNEVARELNVPTTSTRMRQAAAQAAQAAAAAAAANTNSSTATNSPTSTPASRSDSIGTGTTVSPPGATIIIGPARTFSSEAQEDSDDEMSPLGPSNPRRRRLDSLTNSAASLALGAVLGRRAALSPIAPAERSSDAAAQRSESSSAPRLSSHPGTTGSSTSAVLSSPISPLGVRPPQNTATTRPPTPASTTPQAAGTGQAPSAATGTGPATSQATVTTQAGAAQQQRQQPTAAVAGNQNAQPTAATTSVASQPARATTQTSGTQTGISINPNSNRRPSWQPLTRYNNNNSNISSNTSESSASSSSSTTSDSGYSSALMDNPFIRHTYLPANRQPDPADVAPPPTGRYSARLFLRRRAISPGRMRGPPTAAEAARLHQQRQRDIRFLTESYNKINQVYEVLMIMHMVIHRNQVEIDAAASTDPTANNNE